MPYTTDMEKLLNEFYPLLKYLATMIFHKYHLGYILDIEDLISEGFIGLYDANEKYDIDKSNGSKFKTYADIRIRGAMFDAIRKNTPESRSQLDKVKEGKKKKVRFLFLDDPDHCLTMQEFKNKKYPKDKYCLDYKEDSSNIIEVLCSGKIDEEEEILDEIIDKKILIEILKKYIDRLKEKRRICLYMYFYQEKTQKEISKELKLAESTVSSHINRGLNDLRNDIDLKKELEQMTKVNEIKKEALCIECNKKPIQYEVTKLCKTCHMRGYSRKKKENKENGIAALEKKGIIESSLDLKKRRTKIVKDFEVPESKLEKEFLKDGDIELMKPLENEETVITLDFSGRENVLNDIKKISLDECRILEQQIIYCVKHYIKVKNICDKDLIGSVPI